jgi:hypothetical protein
VKFTCSWPTSPSTPSACLHVRICRAPGREIPWGYPRSHQQEIFSPGYRARPSARCQPNQK